MTASRKRGGPSDRIARVAQIMKTEGPQTIGELREQTGFSVAAIASYMGSLERHGLTHKTGEKRKINPHVKRPGPGAVVYGWGDKQGAEND